MTEESRECGCKVRWFEREGCELPQAELDSSACEVQSLRAQAAELGRMYAVIQSRPHSLSCDVRITEDGPCDCWKANALQSLRTQLADAEKKAAEWKDGNEKLAAFVSRRTDEFNKEKYQLCTQLEQKITGETSDGYHTFNELYEHRHAMFSILCRDYNGWKSKLHADGTMFDGWFIAGIQTPSGQATYHLPLAWWNRLKCCEFERAPEWDGHTSDDVLRRLHLMPSQLEAKERHVVQLQAAMHSMESVVEEKEREIEQLRELIEDAGHDSTCRYVPGYAAPCDCWVAKALTPETKEQG